jgi:hypothetical protein
VFHNRKSSLTSIVIGKMGLVEGYEALTWIYYYVHRHRALVNVIQMNISPFCWIIIAGLFLVKQTIFILVSANNCSLSSFRGSVCAALGGGRLWNGIGGSVYLAGGGQFAGFPAVTHTQRPQWDIWHYYRARG